MNHGRRFKKNTPRKLIKNNLEDSDKDKENRNLQYNEGNG